METPRIVSDGLQIVNALRFSLVDFYFWPINCYQ